MKNAKKATKKKRAPKKNAGESAIEEKAGEIIETQEEMAGEIIEVQEEAETVVVKEEQPSQELSEEQEMKIEDTVEISRPKPKGTAEDTRKTVESLLRTARQALKYFDYEDALSILEKAHESLYATKKEPAVIGLLMEIMVTKTRIFEMLGKWDEAITECNDLFEYRDTMKDNTPIIQALIIKGEILGNRGHYSQSVETLKKALSVADKSGDQKNIAMSCYALGKLYCRTGEGITGRMLLERADGIAMSLTGDPEMKNLMAAINNQMGLIHFRKMELEEAGDLLQGTVDMLKDETYSSERALAFRYLGITHSMRQDYKKGLKYLSMALWIYKKTGDIFGQAKVYNSLGRSLADISKLDDAVLFLEKSEKICRKLSADAEAATIYGKLGSVYVLKEEFDRAKTYFIRDIEMSKRFENNRAQAFAYGNIGECNIYLGMNREAIENLTVSSELFRKMGDQVSERKVLLNLCTAHINEGSLDKAREITDALSAIISTWKKSLDLATLLMLKGIIERHNKNWAESSKYFNEALEMMKPFGRTVKLAQAYYEYGLMSLAIHDRDGALAKFREAYQTARDLGLKSQRDRYFKIIERIDDQEIVKVLIDELE